MSAITFSALTWDQLEINRVPGVKDVWFDEDIYATNVFVSIDKKYYGHAKQVAFAIWSTLDAHYIGKYVIVVDSDIDIHNPKKVWAAIANRTNPSEHVEVIFWEFIFGLIQKQTNKDVIPEKILLEIKEYFEKVEDYERCKIISNLLKEKN